VDVKLPDDDGALLAQEIQGRMGVRRQYQKIGAVQARGGVKLYSFDTTRRRTTDGTDMGRLGLVQELQGTADEHD
jgi:hypothetical protein